MNLNEQYKSFDDMTAFSQFKIVKQLVALIPERESVLKISDDLRKALHIVGIDGTCQEFAEPINRLLKIMNDFEFEYHMIYRTVHSRVERYKRNPHEAVSPSRWRLSDAVPRAMDEIRPRPDTVPAAPVDDAVGGVST